MAENLTDTNVENIDYIRREDAVNTVIPAMVDGADAEIVEGLIYMIEPADVVSVVRCADCEWATKSTELPGWYMCKCEEAFDYYAKPDDFCSHGERKE